ncbi:hypothetical protein [Roseomonas indoligenes]|uniref:Uncharacterized protein n=1 Tax=Roseomonas indoligenes TaxID=2820811 RepID=A0A940MU30_9PROT|nr:hypothetical protein [Pararoseomonas indoligenes]MBP0493444.1 hypothetical protein [Pararoseomonas indoligenes]
MPHRLLRLAEALRARQGAPRPASRAAGQPVGRPGGRFGGRPTSRFVVWEVNDNARPIEEGPQVAAPDPKWPGPGTILSLSVQDGRHRLGAVRAAVQETTGDPAADAAILMRLLEHYGAWMGFEGQVDPVRQGEMRRLPSAVRRAASVEYRMDLRQIGRDAQSLTADGTILVNGRPAAVLDDVSIVFRPTRPDPRSPVERRTRQDA